MSERQSTLEARARKVARSIGLVARKSRWRANTTDNYGKFMLIEPLSNQVIGGERFDLSAQAVMDYCTISS